MQAKKPHPYDLNLEEIINFDKINIKYRCYHCDADISHYMNDERFCHHCGNQINWGVLLNVNKEMFAQYISLNNINEKIAFFNAINQMNLNYKYSSPCLCNPFSEKSLNAWNTLYEKAYKKCLDLKEGEHND